MRSCAFKVSVDLTRGNGEQGSPKVSLPESSNTLMSSLSIVRVGIEGTDISLPGSFALELLNLHEFSVSYLVMSIPISSAIPFTT